MRCATSRTLMMSLWPARCDAERVGAANLPRFGNCPSAFLPACLRPGCPAMQIPKPECHVLLGLCQLLDTCWGLSFLFFLVSYDCLEGWTYRHGSVDFAVCSVADPSYSDAGPWL